MYHRSVAHLRGVLLTQLLMRVWNQDTKTNILSIFQILKELLGAFLALEVLQRLDQTLLCA